MNGYHAIAPLALASIACAQAWQEVKPVSSPSKRYHHSMTYDSARERTVLFGGYNFGQNRHFQDTWEYDGSTWTRRAPSTQPSARRLAGMCFDERRGVTVLFGGFRGSSFGRPTYFADTWEYDGHQWRKVSPVGAVPSPRFAALSYDSARGVVVLFGGTGEATPYTYNDTWEYDGLRWTKRTPAVSPPARPDYASAYDVKRGKTVVHPGHIMSHSTRMITWEWDGVQWQRSVNSTLPPPFPSPAMAYDSLRKSIVMVGSIYASQAETWEFDGRDWRRQTASPLPVIGLANHALVYDRQRRATVMFGGEKVRGRFIEATQETWEYAAGASYKAFGIGCSRHGAIPILAATHPPRTGSTLVSKVSNLTSNDQAYMVLGLSNSSWIGGPLPADLAFLGLPGCQLRTSIDAIFPLMSQAGTATWSVPIPLDPGLHGVTFYNQALVVDGTGSAARAITNAAKATVGR